MKNLKLLATLLLAACAKAPLPPSAPPTGAALSRASLFQPFDQTSGESEERLLALASLALRNGIPLDGPRAEKCWRAEEARPRVREACLLLWAGSDSPSGLLEGELLAGRTRAAAASLLMRPALLRGLTYGSLLSLLQGLNEDPLWLKAELTQAWLSHHGRPGIKEAEALVGRLWPAEGSGPRDLSSALRAIRRLRLSSWQAIFGTYCDPATAGEARLRCWRMLGALADRPGSLNEFQSFLPSPDDGDWTLFTRTFPHLAQKIQAASR